MNEGQQEVSATLDRPARSLVIEGRGNLPSLELLARADGTIKFRYVVEEGDYPGFDGRWRVMSENEQREHLQMGGKIAEWLRALDHEGETDEQLRRPDTDVRRL